MKYLILLLAVFMFGNVKAEETYTYKDVYRSLSYEDKKIKQDLCEFGDYFVETSYAEKADDCVYAYFFLDEQQNKELQIKYVDRDFLEKYRYLVKAGNYYQYAFSKDRVETKELISKMIHETYDDYCINEIKSMLLFQTVLCENLLMYKGFDKTKVRTTNRTRFVR